MASHYKKLSRVFQLGIYPSAGEERRSKLRLSSAALATVLECLPPLLPFRFLLLFFLFCGFRYFFRRDVLLGLRRIGGFRDLGFSHRLRCWRSYRDLPLLLACSRN